MQDDVWAAGTSTPQAETAPPAALHAGMAASDLLGVAFKELQLDPWGWGKAGLGFLLPMLGAVFVIVGVVFLPLMIGALSGDDTILLIGQIAGLSLYILLLLLIVIGSPLLLASLARAADAKLRRNAPIGFSAAWSTATQDLGKVIGTQLLVMAITVIGMLACYVPGLVASVILGNAVPLVAIKGLSPTEAVTTCWNHARKHTGWFAVYWLLGIVVTMAVYYVPCVGLAFAMPFLAIYQILGLRVLELKETS